MGEVGRESASAAAGGRFAAPQPDAMLVLSPQAQRQLADPGMRVGAIVAPSGYGKTSTAADWVALDGRPTAWVDLDAGHDDPRVLLATLGDALCSVTDFPSGDLPGGGMSTDQYATGVAPALGRAVRSCTVPFLLVLDDIHLLRGDLANHLVGAVAANVPDGSAMLLVGRECHVGELVRLRASKTTVEIMTEALALDAGDVGELLARMGVDAPASVASVVADQTEGWPVGVRFAGLAALSGGARPGPEPVAVSGRETVVFEYLGSQWLGGVSDEERAFLTEVSPLEWLSGPLCNAVLDRNDSGEVLYRIFRNRMLLVPLDRRAEAYRMHGLLREALESELGRADPVAVQRVHERASRWFEHAGDLDRAVRHAVSAADLDRAEQLVVASTPSLYTAGSYATIDRWLQLLPRDRVLRNPALCLSAALAAMGMGRGEALYTWLKLGEHAAASRPDTDETTRLCLLDVRSTTTIGPARPARDAAAAAYHGLPPGIWHAASCLAYAGWTWAVGEDGAPELLVEGAEEAAVHGGPVLDAYCSAFLAFIAHTGRDLARARALVERARAVASEHGLVQAPGLAMVSAVHSLTAASSGDAPTATTSWQLARTQLAQMATVSGWANVQTRVALAQASVLLNDRIGAETNLSEAKEFLVRQPDAARLIQQVGAIEELVGSMQRFSGTGASALTTAELRVLHYLPTNLSLAAIGERLYVSRYTVKTHCGSIYRKLGVNTRSEAVDASRVIGLL